MLRWLNKHGYEKQIYDIVTRDIEKAAEELVNEANAAGGYDNITVIIIK